MPNTTITISADEKFAALFQVIIELRFIDKVMEYDIPKKLRRLRENKYSRLKNNHVVEAINQSTWEELADITKKSLSLYSHYN